MTTNLSVTTRAFPGRAGFAAFGVNEAIEATQPSEDILNSLCTLMDHTFDEVTLAFSEKSNRWTSFYSFIGENYSSSNAGLISFKKGKIYKHNNEATSNMFYGFQYNFGFSVSNNANSTLPKTYKYTTIHSLKPLNTYLIDERGFYTYIFSPEFKKKERTFYHAIMKDSGTLTVPDPSGFAARHRNKDIRDYFLMQHVWGDVGEYNKVMSTSVGYKVSRGHLD
jgi:hypothetical protein